MSLAYQRAFRPYKRLVFDEITFLFLYMFCQYIFLGDAHMFEIFLFRTVLKPLGATLSGAVSPRQKIIVNFYYAAGIDC